MCGRMSAGEEGVSDGLFGGYGMCVCVCVVGECVWVLKRLLTQHAHIVPQTLVSYVIQYIILYKLVVLII